jgi:hypothetical protein
MKARILSVGVIAALLVTGCATVSGPSVMVLPGSGKNFDQFQIDDASCRQFASQQIGAPAADAATRNTVGGAAIGTLLGAAAGAAIGAAAGSPATGAAVGAGVGLLGGSAAGASSGSQAYVSVQRRYDAAYMQCMYAKGNQIPVSRSSAPAYSQSTSSPRTPAAAPPPPPPPPPPPAGTPPPPPGAPPPPPPGVR